MPVATKVSTLVTAAGRHKLCKFKRKKPKTATFVTESVFAGKHLAQMVSRLRVDGSLQWFRAGAGVRSPAERITSNCLPPRWRVHLKDIRLLATCTQFLAGQHLVYFSPPIGNSHSHSLLLRLHFYSPLFQVIYGQLC